MFGEAKLSLGVIQLLVYSAIVLSWLEHTILNKNLQIETETDQETS